MSLMCAGTRGSCSREPQDTPVWAKIGEIPHARTRTSSTVTGMTTGHVRVPHPRRSGQPRPRLASAPNDQRVWDGVSWTPGVTRTQRLPRGTAVLTAFILVCLVALLTMWWP
jgi:Tfp pilus assembly protein PilX